MSDEGFAPTCYSSPITHHSLLVTPRRLLAHGDGHVLGLAAAQQAQRDAAADAVGAEALAQAVDALDRLAGDRDDDVADHQPALRGRAAVLDGHQQEPVLLLQPLRLA